MCSMTWTGKTALRNMSFIALMTILANTVCYLCTWTSKQMVLQFQEILGIDQLLQPLKRVMQEKFIPPFLDDHPHPELNATSWNSPQDGRDGLTILSSTAELYFGAVSNITAPIAIHISVPVATSIKGKAIKFFEIQNGKPNSLKWKKSLINFLLLNKSAGVCQTK